MSEESVTIPLPKIRVEGRHLIICIPADPELIHLVEVQVLPILFDYVKFRLKRIKEGLER